MKNTFRRLLCALLAAAALWTVAAAAPAQSAEDAARALPLALLRFSRADLGLGAALSLPTELALRALPLLSAPQGEIAEAWSNELQQAPDPQHDTQDDEGTVLTQPKGDELPPITVTDNGVPARTLRPSDPAGYVIRDGVWINNASARTLAADDVDFRVPEGAPLVLIVHTHGTEAYTMPPGEEYVPSDDHRTLDEAYSVLRVGDELARVLEAAGLTVLHDRGLYDYPNYNGAYARSLEAVERCRAAQPELVYVLDVHRDAVEDAKGNEYKLVTSEEPAAAQLELIVGTDGSGAEHPRWKENLNLACAVQRTLQETSPTLMRPIVVRNARYNQHVTDGALLLEVGAAGNSLQEALLAVRRFGAGYAETILRAGAG